MHVTVYAIARYICRIMPPVAGYTARSGVADFAVSLQRWMAKVLHDLHVHMMTEEINQNSFPDKRNRFFQEPPRVSSLNSWETRRVWDMRRWTRSRLFFHVFQWVWLSAAVWLCHIFMFIFLASFYICSFTCIFVVFTLCLLLCENVFISTPGPSVSVAASSFLLTQLSTANKLTESDWRDWKVQYCQNKLSLKLY